ncbi:hypothetical protein SSX86_027506 [Deinandra increscens subsp. villosa]|uniref:DUF4283 domain-containing protein n=1 Tax=Deinandra increscens subsp. villosa TaxID=3103831 RepID=A0AAP0CHV4_9ASTR
MGRGSKKGYQTETLMGDPPDRGGRRRRNAMEDYDSVSSESESEKGKNSPTKIDANRRSNKQQSKYKTRSKALIGKLAGISPELQAAITPAVTSDQENDSGTKQSSEEATEVTLMKDQGSRGGLAGNVEEFPMQNPNRGSVTTKEVKADLNALNSNDNTIGFQDTLSEVNGINALPKDLGDSINGKNPNMHEECSKNEVTDLGVLHGTVKLNDEVPGFQEPLVCRINQDPKENLELHNSVYSLGSYVMNLKDTSQQGIEVGGKHDDDEVTSPEKTIKAEEVKLILWESYNNYHEITSWDRIVLQMGDEFTIEEFVYSNPLLLNSFGKHIVQEGGIVGTMVESNKMDRIKPPKLCLNTVEGSVFGYQCCSLLTCMARFFHMRNHECEKVSKEEPGMDKIGAETTAEEVSVMEHDGVCQQIPLNIKLGEKRSKNSDDNYPHPNKTLSVEEESQQLDVKKLKPSKWVEHQNSKKFHKIWQSKNRGMGKNMPLPSFREGFRPLIKADNFYINSSYRPGDASFQINRKKANKAKSTKELLKEWEEKEKYNNKEATKVPGLEKDYSICNQVVDLSRLKPTEFKTKRDEKGEVVTDENMEEGNNPANEDKVAPKTSYAQMVDGVVRKPFGDKIQYYPPATLPDGSKAIMVTPKIVHKAKEIYRNLLYGYFVGAEPTLGFVKFNLNRMWRSYGIQEINYNGSGIFLFKFKELKQMNTVFDLGPWIVANIPLCLKKWEAGVNMSRAAPKTVPVWIVFKDLPLELWETESICRLASCIGTPLTFDKITKTKCANLQEAGGFARVLVEVGVECDFQDHVQACYPSNEASQPKVVDIAVEYQNRPQMCSYCQVFGHSCHKCKLRPRTLEELEAEKKETENPQTNKTEEVKKATPQTDDEGFTEVTYRKQKSSKNANANQNANREKSFYVARRHQNNSNPKPNSGPDQGHEPMIQQNTKPMQAVGASHDILTSKSASKDTAQIQQEPNLTNLRGVTQPSPKPMDIDPGQALHKPPNSAETNFNSPKHTQPIHQNAMDQGTSSSKGKATSTMQANKPPRNVNPKVNLKEMANRFILLDEDNNVLPEEVTPCDPKDNHPSSSTTHTSASRPKPTTTPSNTHCLPVNTDIPHPQACPQPHPSTTTNPKSYAEIDKEVNREWIAKQQSTLENGVFDHLSNNQKGDILNYVHNRIIPPKDVIDGWIPTERCYYKNMCSLNNFIVGYQAVEDIEEINGDGHEGELMEEDGNAVNEVAQEQNGMAKFMVEDTVSTDSAEIKGDGTCGAQVRLA